MRCAYKTYSRHRTKVTTLSAIALLFSNRNASGIVAASRMSAKIMDSASTMTPSDLPSAAFVSNSNLSRKRPRFNSYDYSSLTSKDVTSPNNGHLPHQSIRFISTNTAPLHAKPKSGSIVDSYQTVSVNCSKCRTRLFRYKKKNGTKSNLIKCYIERIAEDSAGILEVMGENIGEKSGEAQAVKALEGQEWACPDCGQRFGRRTLIHGRPAIKLVGGKVRMTKK